MIKQSKMVYVLGSIVIGILAVLGIIAGLIFGGVFDASPRTLVFTSGSLETTYDGKTLTCDEWALESGELKEGHQAKVTIVGEQTSAGTSENVFSVNILDANGADVTSDYGIVCKPGTLTVYKRPYEIKCIDGVKECYDGTPVFAHDYEYLSGSLVEGHSIGSINYLSSRIDAGESANEATATIVDANGEDVTENYEFKVLPGKLKVYQRPVTFKIDGEQKDYDGNSLTKEVVPEITSEIGIVDGEIWDYKVTGKQTNAGSSKNEFTITVAKADGTPSTSNYDITYVKGDLVVNPRVVYVKTDSVMETYTGNPVCGAVDGYQVVSDFLDPDEENVFLNGDRISVTVTGKRTDVGKENNTATISIVKADGKTSAFSNYRIEYQLGTIEVLPINLLVRSKSTTKPYTGNIQSLDEVEVATTSLLPGHRVLEDQIVFLHSDGEKIDVGSWANVFDPESVIIVDEYDNPVTHLYNVQESFGTINIFPIEICISTGSASKAFDNTPLTCNGPNDYFVTGDLLSGHVIDIEITGSIIYPGTVENVFIVHAILDTHNQGRNVYNNYTIVKAPGQLAIFDSGNNPGTDTEEEDISDFGNISNSGDGSYEKNPAYEVLSAVDGRVYLRYASFGDYQLVGNNSSWGDAHAYTGNLSVSPLHYSYESLIASGKTPYNINVKRLGNNIPYGIPYYSDLSGINELSDSYISKTDMEYSYTFVPYDAEDYSLGRSLNTYSSEEIDYRDFVHRKYKQLPFSTREYLEEFVIPNLGVSANNPDIIKIVAEFVRTKVDYNLNYSFNGDVAVEFFRDAETAICQHFATAATALYRALDIPARYVVGLAGSVTANKKTILYTPGHAWVEVYLDGMGWMPVEVTGGDGYGGFTPDNEGTVNTGIMVKPYDYRVQGNMNTVITYENSTKPNELQGDKFISLCNQNGYTYEFKVDGTQSGLGITKTEISYFVLRDASGKDITSEYEFNLKSGELQVYDREITVYTAGGEWTYDGEEHGAEGYEILGDGLALGHRVSKVSYKTKIRDCGYKSNVLGEFVIVDANGYDVTEHYKINKQYGLLSVKVREIVITADSKEKAYDGTALSCSTYQISGELVEGDVITVEISGKITGKGRTSNKVVSHVIKNKFGRNVTQNYTADYVNGTLRIY